MLIQVAFATQYFEHFLQLYLHLKHLAELPLKKSMLDQCVAVAISISVPVLVW